VQSDADLHADWFMDAKSVGITAGTSTPDHVVDRVERRIRELATVWDDGASLAGEQNP
jgi:4-hydroxy-3-methylbut-2-enyl diphosphate reductase IspH